jgi:adenylate kinase family enzyme
MAKRKITQSDGSYSYQDDTAFNLYREIGANKDSADAYKAARAASANADKIKWQGFAMVPPNSPLDTICRAFQKYTDHPLEIPFHTTFAYIAAWLHQEGVKVRVGKMTATPELWTVVLAPSGSGKTYSADRMAKSAPKKPNIDGFASGAALHENMMENEAKGETHFIFTDEIAQLQKQIESPTGPLVDVKPYLLKAYGGAPLTRKTMARGEQVVKCSATTILGLNTTESYVKALTEESMLDGFAQRFAFVLAMRDRERPHTKHPRYEDESIEAECKAAWQAIAATELHNEYTYTAEALEAFDIGYKEVAIECDITDTQVSFYRRLMMRTHKLALIYHILRGDKSDKIGTDDIAWALRLIRSHIADASTIIMMKSPEATELLKQARALDEKLTAKGKTLSPRELKMNLHKIKTSKDPEAAKLLYTAYQRTK